MLILLRKPGREIVLDEITMPGSRTVLRVISVNPQLVELMVIKEFSRIIRVGIGTREPEIVIVGNWQVKVYGVRAKNRVVHLGFEGPGQEVLRIYRPEWKQAP